jgi:type I restriction enzyme S subunit
VSVYQRTGITFIRSQNVYDDGLRLDDVVYISKEINNQMQSTVVQPGDILLNITGASIGRCSVVPDNFDTANINQHVSIIRLADIKLQAYIHKVLISDYMQLTIRYAQVGAAREGLPAEKQRKMMFPLPPLAEQRRIVAAIESVFALIDAIERSKADVQAAVAAAKSKIISLAICGQLVPQDPADEPASVLLERARIEREALEKSGKIKRGKGGDSGATVCDSSYYGKMPEGWTWVRVDDVFIINPRNYADDMVAASFVSMAMIDNGYTNRFEYQEKFWGEIKSGFTHFQDGDIGMAKITPCLENGKSVVFRGLVNGIGAGTTELHIFRQIVDSLICPDYFLWFVKSASFINGCINAFTGTVGQQRVGKEFVANTLFPLPPLSEQRRIVATIQTVFEKLDRITESLK